MSDIENKYNFQKLTPVENVDLGLYEDALQYIMTTPDIHNVAVSGPYGAGKSSLINSYKKKKGKQSSFIHISLAHFNMINNNSTEVSESELEGKIINQLIHQIQPNKISQTNFKIKNNISGLNIISSTTLITVFILALLHIVFFTSWNVFVTSLPNTWIQSLLNFSINKYSVLLSGIIALTIFYRFLYLIIKAQKSKNLFRKLRLQGNEIEIFEESDDSLFDKYLNEVLYLFENVEAEVIVFEDIDRFDANGIFARLHEINTLVNMKKKKNNQKSLRFFYLLSDDIFTSKDRTKFFDYILPVVPVIDSSNSHNKFIELFKSGKIYEIFNEEFLYGLSLYVDDMRVLKNVYNEFQIYYNQLNTTELNPNKMLAIITYKNLFPRDFSQLQLNQGMVYALFSKKNEFIENEVSKLEQSIWTKKQEIESVYKENLVSIEELELVYRDKNAKISQTAPYHTRDSLYKDLENQLALRKNAIKTVESDGIALLENELLEFEEELNIIFNKRLSEIISRENIDEIFKVTMINNIGEESNFYEIKGNEYFPLLKYLIRNGYIDESYADYVTYFYEDSLSRTDKTFLRSLTDKKAKEFSYRLEKPSMICKKLKSSDFNQEEILNFDLLNYLFETKNKTFINQLIYQLKDDKKFEFVKSYFENSTEIESYVYHINLEWPQLFGVLLKERILSDEQIYHYSILSLNVSSKDTLVLMNEGDVLKEYILNKSDYLNTEDLNIEKTIVALSTLGISLNSISEANPLLLKAVYENSLYVINNTNLLLMLNEFYPEGTIESYKSRNYTEILQMPESPLSKYIEDNINEYISAMLSIDDGNIEDEEKFVLSILNNEKISLDQKKLYVSRLTTIISTIAEVGEKNIWSELLSKKLIRYSIQNIIDFFLVTNSLNKVLISYINDCESIINYSDVENHYGTDIAKSLLEEAVNEDRLSDAKYREILVGLNFEYDDFDVKELSNEKINIVIEEKIIKMNEENLKFVRINYQPMLMNFIKANINEYVFIMTEDLIVYEELLQILDYDFDDNIKIKLLSITKKTFSILNDNYSLELKKFILDNNIDVNELSHLYSRFEEFEEEIIEKIFILAKSKPDSLFESSEKISNLLSRRLLSSEEVDNVFKIRFLDSLISKIDIEHFKEYIDIMNLEEYKKIFEAYKRPKIEINESNRALLSKLEENEWIIGYSEDEKKTGYYKVSKK